MLPYTSHYLVRGYESIVLEDCVRIMIMNFPFQWCLSLCKCQRGIFKFMGVLSVFYRDLLCCETGSALDLRW